MSGITRAGSPASYSENKTSSESDEASASDSISGVEDIFQTSSRDWREICENAGYEITEEEWAEIAEAEQHAYPRGAEAPAMNFVLAKLAMKKLNPAMFRQAAPHVSSEDFRKLKDMLEACSDVVDEIEDL